MTANLMVFKGVAIALLWLIPVLVGCFSSQLAKLNTVLIFANSFVGGFLLGISALHLPANASSTVGQSGSSYSVCLAFSLSILAALLIDEKVRYSAYRWLPTEEQLKPSCFGEVVFPMLFDGTNDWVSGSLLFAGLTLQYLLGGMAIGIQSDLDILTFFGVILYKGLAAGSLSITVDRTIPSISTRWKILMSFSATAPIGLALGWLISLSNSRCAAAVVEATCAGYMLYIVLLQVLSRALSTCAPSIPHPQLSSVISMITIGFTVAAVFSSISSTAKIDQGSKW